MNLIVQGHHTIQWETLKKTINQLQTLLEETTLALPQLLGKIASCH